MHQNKYSKYSLHAPLPTLINNSQHIYIWQSAISNHNLISLQEMMVKSHIKCYTSLVVSTRESASRSAVQWFGSQAMVGSVYFDGPAEVILAK